MLHLIFAVLLTIAQAPPPVPRQAPDNATSTRQHIKNQPRSNKAPSPPSGTSINTDTTNRNETENNGIRTQNAGQPVRITELPSVSVSPHKRDWADWGYWIFNGLLVLVGGFQVWLLFRTLRAIQRQADIYERQWTQMIEAGRQTDQIIETMKDTAKRELRAYVCISSAQIGFMRERAPEVHIRYKNYGKTPAYDVRVWIGVGLRPHPLGEYRLDPPSPDLQMSTSIFAPGGKPHTMTYRHEEILEEIMPMLGTPELTLYAYGEITYRDAFGEPRSTKYRLMYGGAERAIPKDKKGVAVALLKPDTEGNEAT